MLGEKLSLVWVFIAIAHLSLELQQPLCILRIH